MINKNFFEFFYFVNKLLYYKIEVKVNRVFFVLLVLFKCCLLLEFDSGRLYVFLLLLYKEFRYK